MQATRIAVTLPGEQPGDVTIHALDSLVPFDKTSSDDTIAVTWTNDSAVQPAGRSRVEVRASGTGTVFPDDQHPSLTMDVEIRGFSETSVMVTAMTNARGELTGEGTADGTRLFTIRLVESAPQITWASNCSR